MTEPGDRPDLLIHVLSSRLAGDLRSWPSSLRQALMQYLEGARAGNVGLSPAPADTAASDPFWLRLPQLLARKYLPPERDRAGANSWLGEVLWGQWCLFLSFRLQDDLFDQDADNPSLVLVSNLLRLESERIFHELLGADHRFWTLFRDCQAATYRAAAEIDRLQTGQGASSDEILGLYAQASRIFSVGGTAVCLACGEVEDVETVRRLYDHLAVAGQIVDDLMDIEEDLNRDRHSYATDAILGSAPEAKQRRGSTRQALLRSLIFGDGSQAITEAIAEQLDGASARVHELGLPDGVSVLREFSVALQQLEEALHRLRVEIALGPLLTAE